jgi:hypothetical protein
VNNFIRFSATNIRFEFLNSKIKGAKNNELFSTPFSQNNG